MPTPEEDNHAARKEANEKLGDLNNKVDDLKESDVDKSELPGGTDEAKLSKFKDEVEEQIDKVQEAINTNRISEADSILRRLRNRIKKVLRDGASKTDLLNLIKAVRTAKRRITAPPVILAAFQPGNADQAVFVSAEDVVGLSAREVFETSLSSLGLSRERLKLAQDFGLRTVGDLVEWRNSKAVKEHTT